MSKFVESLPLARNRPLIGYAFALISPLAALAARLSVGHALGSGYPYVTFFPAVVLTAFLFGLGPGILSSLLCGIMARYFFIAPIHSFSVGGPALAPLAFYAVVIAIDLAIIHFMQRSNHHLALEREASRRASELRAVMFDELQHRVSNKLQVIASLLTLQRRTIEDPDARKALEDAARRVGMVGRISRALHHPDGGEVGMEPLLRQVAADILDASGANGIETRFSIDADARVSPDAAVPFALVYAEALSNALEHAFAGRDSGVLDIVVTRAADGAIQLVVADDGAGLPEDFNLKEQNSLGLRIATTLARQLNGRFALEPGGAGGARAVVTLPG